jgi:hypothetical protein
MAWRVLPYFEERLKPRHRIVRLVVLDLPTYARAYVVIDDGAGRFNFVYRSAGTVTDTDSEPSFGGTGYRWDGLLSHIEIVERRGHGMSGPTLSRDRHEYVDEEEAFEAAQQLADKWL